jgi:cation diffusion facilitator CzcD-associated flavoprotein CzcO
MSSSAHMYDVAVVGGGAAGTAVSTSAEAAPNGGHLVGQEAAARAGSPRYDDGAVFRVDDRDLQVNKFELRQPAGIAVSGREVWVSAVDECC